MDKNLNLDQFKESLKKSGAKILAYRFYLVSIAVLALLSVVILDVSIVTEIEPDPSKIEAAQNDTTRQLEQSIVEQIEQRLNQSSQSVDEIPSSDPFNVSD